MRKLLILLILFALCSCSVSEVLERPSEYVNTLVGTQSTYSFSSGNTYPAIALPWAMNFWTPQTGKNGDGWTYSYTDLSIRGFKQTHQPSPWINDYGYFSIMPVRGNVIDEEERQSCFSHKSEDAHPYYYKVYLADHDIVAEIAPTERAAIMRFTFPASNESGIVIDASYSYMIDNHTIAGFSTRNSGGVPDNFKNYFVIVFDKEFESIHYEDELIRLAFTTQKGEQIVTKIASSFISEEFAFRNLDTEIGSDDFDTIKEKAQNRWDEVLSKIEVSGGTTEQYRTFYSCLYRSTLFPRKFYELDENGSAVHYSPYNGKVLPGYMYTDTGFWDTFRALFPLLNLVYPSVNAEIQAGLANAYRESGFLPEWASPGHRDCMVGNNSASVVSDAILKGITPNEDIALLYEAMMSGRNKVHPIIKSTGRLGHEYYNTLGYVPYNVGIKESAARTLEYAYDDWCIAQVAGKLGFDNSELLAASQNYKNLFDPQTKLMRAKDSKGIFEPDFNPYKWGGAFTEGNSWHYTWSVFHDVEGLANLMGGKEEMSKILDSVFVVPPIYDDSYYGFRIHEITEMQVANMGNYAHGNQPAQHIVYLYDYLGYPEKTQYWVREVMNRMYSATPDGYCGDEDNGQTSAWYVFSALGFYPLCPCSDSYAAGAPLFKKAQITLENGKKISITSLNDNPCKSIICNGKALNEPFLDWHTLKNGSTIKFL